MLDRFLQALSDPKAQELRLASGSAPTLIYSEGPQPISTSQLSTSELIDLMAGVLTIDQIQRLKKTGSLDEEVKDYGPTPLKISALLEDGILEAVFSCIPTPESEAAHPEPELASAEPDESTPEQASDDASESSSDAPEPDAFELDVPSVATSSAESSSAEEIILEAASEAEQDVAESKEVPIESNESSDAIPVEVHTDDSSVETGVNGSDRPSLSAPEFATSSGAAFHGPSSDEIDPAPISNATPIVGWSSLLEQACEKGATDIHVISGETPRMRIQDSLVEMEGWLPLTADQIEAQIQHMTSEETWQRLLMSRDVDFGYQGASARFRVTAFVDRNGPSMSMRVLPLKPRTVSDLGVPEVLIDAIQQRDGIVLVTGKSSSGKSSTVAALVHYLNVNTSKRIVTIENPIETVHDNLGCIIHQREAREHTTGISRALESARKQDPDVVVISDLSQPNEIAEAIDFAEAGHLVIASMTAGSGLSAIDRILDSLPAYRKDQLRGSLASSLRAVTNQVRAHGSDGAMHMAYEVLVATASVASLIRDEKTFQLPALIQTGGKLGMSSLNDELIKLVRDAKISPEEGLQCATERQDFLRQAEQAGIDVSESSKQLVTA